MFADTCSALAGINAARALHIILLQNIFHQPLSFFDVTPIGRILSRFSEDIETLDEEIMSDLVGVLYCIYEVNLLEHNLNKFLLFFQLIFSL